MSREPQFAWILAVALAALLLLIGVVAAVKWWSAAWAVGSALAIIGVAAVRRQGLALAAGSSMLAAFLLFAAQVSWGDWRPGEFLHAGLALGLWLFARWLAVDVASSPRTATA